MIVCICDIWGKKDILKIEPKKAEVQNGAEFGSERKKETQIIRLPSFKGIFKTSTESEGCEPKKQMLTRNLVRVNSQEGYHLVNEIQNQQTLEENLYKRLCSENCQVIWFQIEPPKKEFIDYKWGIMILDLLWDRIECDCLMSWLSTLGGGYSSLGEQFSNCAKIAGKISLKQLSIGMRLGDPFLQSRCKLYYSISLIQTGNLKAAKHLIRREYSFAKKHTEYDIRLVRMCQGIWLKLQYEYGLRLKEKQKNQNKLLDKEDHQEFHSDPNEKQENPQNQ